jgi:hypothetical protein
MMVGPSRFWLAIARVCRWLDTRRQGVEERTGGERA